MKKKFYLIGATILLINALSAQRIETRNLDAFSELKVNDQLKVILVPSDQNKAVLDVKKMMNEEVRTKITGETLKIWTKGIKIEPDATIRLYYNQELTKISPFYGGRVITDSNAVIKSKILRVDSDIDGFANLNIDVDELHITAHEGSDIWITGRADSVYVYAISGAKVKLNNLVCKNANVHSAMGAKVWLTATDNYTAKAVTGGKIYYAGDPSGKFDKSWYTGGKIFYQTADDMDNPETR